jgi:hypothetical protein
MLAPDIPAAFSGPAAICHQILRLRDRVIVNFTRRVRLPYTCARQDVGNWSAQSGNSRSIPMNSPGASAIRARQICEADIPAIAELLARGFQGRPRQFWLQVLAGLAEHPTPAGLPKYGYMLESDGTAVGALLLIFSRLRSGDTMITRCNVSSWYVEPAFRGYASLFVSKALSHRNVTYLNITPAPHTVPIARALGYSQYSKGVFVAAPALQLPSGAGATVVGVDDRPPGRIEPFERELLLEHAKYGCMSLWCAAGDCAYPFVFRPRVHKGIVPSAQLVYCRDVDDFVRFAGPIGRFLALRGRPLVLIDSNGPIPGLLGKYFDDKMPKYFKGPDQPRLGDLAYTEAAMFGV